MVPSSESSKPQNVQILKKNDHRKAGPENRPSGSESGAGEPSLWFQINLQFNEEDNYGKEE